MLKLINLAALALVLCVSAGNVLAGELKTVTLDVEGMTCSMCPVTVKKALQQVDGVKEVQAKYEGDGKGWAKVTYDAEAVSVDALTFAKEEAGYPSRSETQ